MTAKQQYKQTTSSYKQAAKQQLFVNWTEAELASIKAFRTLQQAAPEQLSFNCHEYSTSGLLARLFVKGA